MPVYSQPVASSSKRQPTPHSSWVSQGSQGSVAAIMDPEYELLPELMGGEEIEEIEGPPHTFDRFPIRKYIHECGLPVYRYKGVESLVDEMNLRSSFRWPDIVSLRIPHEPRQLMKVRRYADYPHVRNDIYSFFSPFNEDEMTCFPPYPFEFLLPFHLPHNKTTVFEDSDRHALSDIQNETEMVTLLNRYLFDTVLSAVCLLHNYNPINELDQPKINQFRFRISNHLFFDKYAKWDIFTLPSKGNDQHAIPLVLIFIHPSNFGVEDFDQLVQERNFENNVLEKPKDPADVIWAILYEILKDKGRRFIVTNYVRWAFGQFDHTHEIGYITEIYESKLTNSAGQSTTIPLQQHCNPIELLIRWMTNIPEKDQIFPNRYVNPREVDEAFGEMMQNRTRPW